MKNSVNIILNGERLNVPPHPARQDQEQTRCLFLLPLFNIVLEVLARETRQTKKSPLPTNKQTKKTPPNWKRSKSSLVSDDKIWYIEKLKTFC